MENPTISLHVIGLNGPAHDLEMIPPDDQRLRYVLSHTGMPNLVLLGLYIRPWLF